MAWYVGGGGMAMSRSSSGPSTPGDLDHENTTWWTEPPYFEGGKRRISITSRYGPEDDEFESTSSKPKKARHVVFTDLRDVVVESVPPFYILREDSSSPAPLPYNARDRHTDSWNNPDIGRPPKHKKPLHEDISINTNSPTASPKRMQTPPSGAATPSSSGMPDPLEHINEHLLTDEQAADSVETHVAENRRRNRHSKHERILKSLIRPKSREGDFEIDDDALQGMFYAANEIFFCGCLKGRVTWEWSDQCNTRFQTNIIGTTALRKASNRGGYETLVILSSHFLKDKNYNRRLLISTFLHELIHSYLFICCGFSARANGGHTDGFRRIASLIDNWAGPQTLHLTNIEADLDDFLADTSMYTRTHNQPLTTSYCSGHIEPGPCSGGREEEHELLRPELEHRSASFATREVPLIRPEPRRGYTDLSPYEHGHENPMFIVLSSKRPEPIWHYEGPVDYRHNRFASKENTLR